MNITNDLIQQISSDLKIFKYRDEDQNDYLNRLLYSAAAVWMIQSINDQIFYDNYNRIGVSKSYLTRKISKIISQYISIFPSFRVFLDGLTETEYAVKLREDYEKSGFIVHVGFDEFVIPSPLKKVRVNDKWLLLRNCFEDIETKAIGLGIFTEDGSEEKECNIEELFYLPKINAHEWTNEYIKNLRWVEATKLGVDTQYFDPTQKKSFFQCWGQQFPDYCEITLYKTNNWDYGFARKSKIDIVGLKIPDWLIGKGNNETENLFNNDVRRFMYGLKAIFNNKSKCIVFKKSDHFELRLLSGLPMRELTALKFLGWPLKGFLNEYNHIIPNEFFDLIKYLLEKLSIEIEVIKI